MPATPHRLHVVADIGNIAGRWVTKADERPSPSQLQELRADIYGYLEACILAAESDAVIAKARK